MHGNSYFIPGARGIQRVFADNTAVSAQVAAAVADFTASFEAFKAKHGDKVDAVAANLFELEQKLADRIGSIGAGGATTGRSPAAALAAHLIKDADFQAAIAGRTPKTRLEIDASMMLGSVEANTITGGQGGSDFFNTKRLQPGIVEGVRKRTWLRSFFPTLPTEGGSVEYHRELVLTNSSAPQGGGSPFVEQGTTKAESSVTYEAVEVKIPTIAHFIKASKQILSDVNSLRMSLENSLLYGLELTIEDQMINGQGSGADMSGLTNAGNYTAFTPTSGDNALDSINRALGAIETAHGAPDLVILHPLDFRAAQRIKATGGSEEYLFGSPNGANGASVWNTPIYSTPSLAQGSFIAADIQRAGTIYERMQAVVDLGHDGNDFTKNLLTLLAEIRLAIAVQRPAMVRFGSLTA